jgi:hypothetical protein
MSLILFLSSLLLGTPSDKEAENSSEEQKNNSLDKIKSEIIIDQPVNSISISGNPKKKIMQDEDINFSRTLNGSEIADVTIENKKLIIKPIENIYGDTKITVTATSNSQKDSKTFKLTINPINDRPKLTTSEIHHGGEFEGNLMIMGSPNNLDHMF